MISTTSPRWRSLSCDACRLGVSRGLSISTPAAPAAGRASRCALYLCRRKKISWSRLECIEIDWRELDYPTKLSPP